MASRPAEGSPHLPCAQAQKSGHDDPQGSGLVMMPLVRRVMTRKNRRHPLHGWPCQKVAEEQDHRSGSAQ